MTAHDLYYLAAALSDEYAAALRAKFPADADYIGARYRRSDDPTIEQLARRQQAAFDAWRHAAKVSK